MCLLFHRTPGSEWEHLPPPPRTDQRPEWISGSRRSPGSKGHRWREGPGAGNKHRLVSGPCVWAAQASHNTLSMVHQVWPPLQGPCAHWVSSGSSSEQVLCRLMSSAPWLALDSVCSHTHSCGVSNSSGPRRVSLWRPASAGWEKGGWVGARPWALPGGFEAPGTWEAGELGLEERRKTEAQRGGTEARQVESSWLGGSSLETARENWPFAYECNCQLTSNQRVWIVQGN